MIPEQQKWLRIAYFLSLVTIAYNLLEGLVSVYFGSADDTLALFGFGLDSFVEVSSGIGVAHMVFRMRRSVVTVHDRFERQALRITGTAFIALGIGLVAAVIVNLMLNRAPTTTLAGIIISGISIFSMYFLMKIKMKAGRALHSEAIISDANCTRACLYLSIILLISSLAYQLFSIPYIDLAGSLGIAWYALKEGREAFEKVKSGTINCC